MEDGREGRDSLTESVGRDCWRRTFLIVIVIVIAIVIVIIIVIVIVIVIVYIFAV